MAGEPSKVWCVQHRAGWCATKDGKKPAETENNVPTRCGFFVVLPWGFERRVPTCTDCEPDTPQPASEK